MQYNKRAKNVFGSEVRPRLTVYRGLKNVYTQIINDEKGFTLVAASSLDKEMGGKKNINIELAKKVGQSLAKKAKAKGIVKVVFDRRDRPYHGIIKAVAEGARAEGLIF
ncbi:MAG: 50S ribosomal protein L18 [Candidatus Margulisiibacteriota bacterium]|jgi:large subunit ribosomal protein L18